ncbi:uncharacterized protein L201_004256 [Kwoniella dendrophila CBS 6074]|uniref:Uncharacterized protein n=1 Tax=Kwoniella dendrophila CBS 6074 TaxID=1295534 RepID=A0AAX4JV58_9TREE
METPNTRSRRKRELENSSSQEDGLKIAWVHDSQLRKAVLRATEDDIMTPPTPTQCSKPISSLLKSSSSFSASGSKSGPGSGSGKLTFTTTGNNKPPRKRPCRQHRSLPTSLNKISRDDERMNGNSGGLPIGSNSLPNQTSVLGSTSTSTSTYNNNQEKTRLDYLLDKFSLLSSPLPMKEEEGSSKNRNKGKAKVDYFDHHIEETPSKNLRSRSTSSTKHQHCDRDRGRSNEIVKTSKPRMITSTPLKKKNPNVVDEVSTTDMDIDLKEIYKSAIPSIPINTKNTTTTTTSSIRRESPTTITRNNSLSPIKGNAPRIGLGSQHFRPKQQQQQQHQPVIPTTYPNKVGGGWTRANSGKAFRTPFLEKPNIHKLNIKNTGSLDFSGIKTSSPKKSTITDSLNRSKSPNKSARGHSIPYKSNSTDNGVTARMSSIKRPNNLRTNTSSSTSSSSTTSVSTTRTKNSRSSSVLNSSLPPTPPPLASTIKSNSNPTNNNNNNQFKNFDVGENEPEDKSFDSFDGIFADGGEEIENVLRKVDGI